MCYYPGSKDIPFTSSSDKCTSSQLRRMVDVHRSDLDTIGPSIVHYDFYTHKALGNSSFTRHNLGHQNDIAVCATGAQSLSYGVQLFQTRCWLPEGDEDLGGTDGDRACSVVHERSRPLEPDCNIVYVEESNFTMPVRSSSLGNGLLLALTFGDLVFPQP